MKKSATPDTSAPIKLTAQSVTAPTPFFRKLMVLARMASQSSPCRNFAMFSETRGDLDRASVTSCSIGGTADSRSVTHFPTSGTTIRSTRNTTATMLAKARSMHTGLRERFASGLLLRGK